MKACRLLRRAFMLALSVTACSCLPWPVMVLLVTVVFGPAVAAALWAFGEGRRLTGPHSTDLHAVNRELAVRLAAVQAERNKLSASAGTVDVHLGTAKDTQAQMVE